LRERLESNRASLLADFERLGGPEDAAALAVDDLLAKAEQWARWLEPHVCDASDLVLRAIEEDRRVLFEGAQGAMLDLDHGTYPYVTSANTVAGGVCTGLGIGPTSVDASWGITKAYTTRVGHGPFPTRLDDDTGEMIRKAGAEFGATTGRPRDCGWLDLPALRLACRKNGLSGLCITKLDVLASLPRAAVCRRYQDGADPSREGFENVVAEYEELQGWGDPTWGAQLSDARRLEDLPGPVRAFLDLVSDAVGVPATLIGVGPDRAQTIRLRDAF
jgi:adenylosuccinate synthase